MKLKVGKKYKVISGDRKGDIIKITGIFDIFAYYVLIENNSGFNYKYDNFNLSSSFAYSLKEIKEKPETIVIYRKDNEVIALDKSTGKKAVAKCAPEDEFNFKTGAKLAFERLTKNVTFRMLCVKGYGTLVTKGKIYEFVDGKTIFDTGMESYYYDSFEDFKEHNVIIGKTCVELKDGDDPNEILKKYGDYYNGKIIFTNKKFQFTKGKIYNIVNGKIISDLGTILPLDKAFYTINNIKAYFGGQETGGFDGKWWDSYKPSEVIEVVE